MGPSRSSFMSLVCSPWWEISALMGTGTEGVGRSTITAVLERRSKLFLLTLGHRDSGLIFPGNLGPDEEGSGYG